MTRAPMSQYIFCSSGMYHLPFSIRMAPTSAARASTHRITAAMRLPVALFLFGAAAGLPGGDLHKFTLYLLFFCQMKSLLFYHKI